MKRKNDITRFEHVTSLSGRLFKPEDRILIAVEAYGEVDWWSVNKPDSIGQQEALDELTLYYRLDDRGGDPLKTYVFRLTDARLILLN